MGETNRQPDNATSDWLEEDEAITEAGQGASCILTVLRAVGLSLGFLVFLLAAAVVTYQWVYDQRILPGIRVVDVDIGALKRTEARLLLASAFEAYSKSSLALNYGEQQWRFNPQELGAKFDLEGTLAEAYAVGREGDIPMRLGDQLSSLREERVLLPVLRIDAAVQEKLLAALAGRIDRAAVNAGLKIENLDVEIAPAQAGRQLNREAAAKLLAQRFTSLSTEPIELSVTNIEPSLLERDLDAARKKAQEIISHPLTLRYAGRNWVWRDGPLAQEFDRKWELDRETIAAMIRFEVEKAGDGQPRLSVKVDTERANAYGKKLARDIEQQPRDARFEWKDGILTPIVTSQEGRRLDLEGFAERLGRALASSDAAIELPVIISKPAVAMENVSKMGIREKIEERSTPFKGAIPEKAANIDLAARRLHGAVVPPGGVFSFNEAVGEVSAKTGYQMGFAIIEGQTVPDAGGGVCQVSTTLFQTVVWAGFPIVERYPHAYRILNYEPPIGLDATVYPPQVDLRFKNNTESYLLIQSRVEESRIFMTLYGTKPLWTVSIDEPIVANIRPADKTEIMEYSTALAKGRKVQVESPQDGMDVTLGRRVIQDGKELLHDTFSSSYRPQRNLVVIGTGE